MNEISRITHLLEAEHDGDPWHGSSLAAILDGISHAQAAARPIPGGHSIWELVLHLAAWKNEVRRRLAGGAAAEPLEGDWPAVGEQTAERWSEAREHLDLAHRLLVSAIKAFPEADLYTPSRDTRDHGLGLGVSYYELLHGLVQHDTYHAGQIALLKKSF